MARYVDPESKLVAAKRFRLTESDATALDEKVAKSGLTESEFIRQAVIQNKTEIRPPIRQMKKKDMHPMSREIIYQIQKEGNNLNQIARQINTARAEGWISNSTFESVLDDLDSIASAHRSIVERII